MGSWVSRAVDPNGQMDTSLEEFPGLTAQVMLHFVGYVFHF